MQKRLVTRYAMGSAENRARYPGNASAAATIGAFLN
jgi:hypothetical protein